MTMSSDINHQEPLRRIRGRGFKIPYHVLPCACDGYWNHSSEPESGSGYSYPNHNRDCRQAKFQDVCKEIFRFSIMFGGLYCYAVVRADRYEAWRKRVKDHDSRFQEHLALWLLIKGQQVVLTPFDRPGGTGSPLSRDKLVALVKTAAKGWQYGQTARIIGRLGWVTHRDLDDLDLTDDSNSGGIPLSLSRRCAQQSQLEAARLEESLGCLGVGGATYLKAHGLTGRHQHLTDCTPRSRLPGGSLACLFAGFEYGRARRRFRNAILGVWRTFWVEAPGMTLEDFEEAKKQAKAEANGLKHQESLRRHEALGLPVMPDLGRFALPKEIHPEVMKLAESSNQSDRGVAHYVADASRDSLMAPLKEWQQAKLGMSVESQRLLAGFGTNSLVDYTLARTRFEQAEAIFQADVQEVLRMHRENIPGLAFRITKDSPPVMRMVA